MNPKMFVQLTLTLLAISTTSARAGANVRPRPSATLGYKGIDGKNHYNNYYLFHNWHNYYHRPPSQTPETDEHNEAQNEEINDTLISLQIMMQEMNEMLLGQIEILNSTVIKHAASISRLEEQLKTSEETMTALDGVDATPPAPPSDTTTQQASNLVVSRTCFDARKLDPSLPSGYYRIDPDGENIGEDPIDVYCDMTTGTTFIHHDSNETLSSSDCFTPGCFSHNITYKVPQNQIEALVQQSGTCQQSIRYDCSGAPLESSGVKYSWWTDRNGKPQYFWSGNGTNLAHTCQCGIENNCLYAGVSCNCDVGNSDQTFDEGVITAHKLLPVKSLHFGREKKPTSRGSYQLGPLKCDGDAIVKGIPTSCLDVWLVGHELSGVYSIKGISKINSVFCDFSKPLYDPGFEVPLGYLDIKSASVYFQVLRNSGSELVNETVTYDVEFPSHSEVMDIESGVFVAPYPGKYFFAFRGIKHAANTKVGIAVNGTVVTETSGDAREPLTAIATLNLNKGDHVSVILLSGSLSNHGVHQFSGFILEEDLIFRAVEAKIRHEAAK